MRPTAPEFQDRVLDCIAVAPRTEGQIAIALDVKRPAVRRVLTLLQAQGRAKVVGHLPVLRITLDLWGPAQ